MKRSFIVFGLVVLLMTIFSCVNALADIDGGVYDNVSWKITDDYELIIGDGTEQSFSALPSRSSNEYPWYPYSSRIVAVSFDGTVHGNGCMDSMFNSMSVCTSIDFDGFDTSLITSMSFAFGGCNSLTSYLYHQRISWYRR